VIAFGDCKGRLFPLPATGVSRYLWLSREGTFTKTSLEQHLEKLSPQQDTVITIGVFDGVHRGHQYLIETLKREAESRNLLSVAMTFETHPEDVLGRAGSLPWLTDIQERTDLLKGLGVGLVTAIPFDKEVAQLKAEEFMGLLKRHVRMKGLVVGPDFALGNSRQGNTSKLSALGRDMGFTFKSVPPLVLEGRIVSSTAVRQAVARGDARDYFRLVGRHYTLCGEVIHGAERGRRLGFPTANLSIDQTRATPADGVYATWAHCDARRHPSVTNIGIRPTFDSSERLAETYVLDFDGDIYGKPFTIEFVERLRDELRFSNVHQLKQQMQRDVDCARILLQAEKVRQ